MRAWLLLTGAIVGEVTGTMALRATVDSSAWMPLVPVAYIVAFVLLGLALRTGMPIGVAYGIWGAVGVSLTAVLGALFFDEFLSPVAIAGIVLIIVGVVLVETGSRRDDAVPEESLPGDGPRDDGPPGADDDEAATLP